MALTISGTVVSLSPAKLPTGYVLPTVTTFTDYEYTRTFDLSILKATVENATDATTLANIIDNVTIGIEKQVSDLLSAEFENTVATVTVYCDLLDINSNIVAKGTTDFYNATAVSYTVSVKAYIKSA